MSRTLFAAGLLVLAFGVFKPTAIEGALTWLNPSSSRTFLRGDFSRSQRSQQEFYAFERIQKSRKKGDDGSGYSGAFDPLTVQSAPLTEYEMIGERVQAR